jgi:hypothetical protein
MSNFTNIQKAVNDQLQIMIKNSEHLFYVDLDKEKLWDLYLSSFPEGTNPIFRERTEHDCNCCKQFIRAAGNIVTFSSDGSLTTIWDCVTNDPTYQPVVDALSTFVKSHQVKNIFITDVRKVGTERNYQSVEDGSILEWNHFHFSFPEKFVMKIDKINTKKGDIRTNMEMLKSGLSLIDSSAVDIVMDLINQNSIYRGQEHVHTVVLAKSLINDHQKAVESNKVEKFLWETSLKIKEASRFKNTVIGTLLVDISSGIDLEVAVKSFESKVAPQNYKRSTALVTKGMITNAQKKVDELGIESSLYRRFANISDITVNNILFVDRESKPKMGGVFDLLEPSVSSKTPSFDKIKEMKIDDFIKNVLPKSETLEVFLENKHASNLVSLVAPIHTDAPNILKWANNFSWSYNGEVTDSIKERVKAAGGVIDADVRASLSWFNTDDLDIFIKHKGKKIIYFGNKLDSVSGGLLDIDMNAGYSGSELTRSAVENVFWKNLKNIPNGNYEVFVNNYNKRESDDVGFEVEIDIMGESKIFSYPHAVRSGENIHVVTLNKTAKGITILSGDHNVVSDSRSIDLWGKMSGNFHKVSVLMNSPNYWDEQDGIGNRHWFFMIDGCKNPNSVRGFYNEFLRNDLNEHRKVFEMLASKTKAEPTDEQLSGIGFSSTKEASLICKVGGSFNRMIKIVF